MMKRTHLVLISVLWMVSMVLASCAPAQQAGPVTIKIAALPILDVLPMVVAQQEGLYAKYNLTVEFVPAASAPERDQLVTAGQADGMVNEVLSTLLFNKDQTTLQVVRFARTADTNQALFRILAAKEAGISQAQELKGIEIGVSQATVIEYLTERLLQAEGLSSNEIKTIAVPKIPDRMSLLASGELKAAMLPEPFSSLAMQDGAVMVLDDTRHPEFSYSVISMRKAFIDQNPEAVKGFLAAVEEAVALINADPQKYSGLMVEQKMVPAPLAEAFPVPTFPTAGVPSEEQFQDAIEWAKGKGYISRDYNYAETVTGQFLPEK